MNFRKMALVLALGAVAASTANARGDADFSLINKTGYAIREVYVSPSKSKTWGGDLLGKRVLDNGLNKNLRFGDSAHCQQDIMVVFDDDESEVTWEDVNLCELEKLTLKYNRKTKEVSAIAE